MATLKVYTDRIIQNVKKLNSFLGAEDIEWSLVTKMLNGNKSILEKILLDESIEKVHSIADSRLSNLKVIKKINPKLVTMYIKPPAPSLAKSIVEFADISMNSSLETIEVLNEEAMRQDVIHKIIVMIEMGELREGVLRDNVLRFYDKVFNLSNIDIIGIGTNLGCMYGIEPTYDKLIQLSLYEQLIEAKFGHNLQIVSGGSSITLPYSLEQKLPKGANHFRIGEAAFLGVSPLNNKKFKNLSTNALEFKAEILEIEKKSYSPDGIVGDGNIGHISDKVDEADPYAESYRAIVDFGVLDVEVDNLISKNKNISYFGTTSDMTVYDLGNSKSKIKVGHKLKFTPNYMAAARLLNSKYVEIEVV
ncbi:MAG: alanine/ornithine racemase family PLP-dependent enzyme [Ignavibacteriae bacterium]|nr:alanine/ornithine racemase family PLP-dependent enzyme [Ignavibacteriota bacterium]NOG97940.1 alanine/ornithine racemase family PLP-dependent enzyme [Ignavibacteriota bacterium]